jgi:hypothetical protein
MFFVVTLFIEHNHFGCTFQRIVSDSSATPKEFVFPVDPETICFVLNDFIFCHYVDLNFGTLGWTRTNTNVNVISTDRELPRTDVPYYPYRG